MTKTKKMQARNAIKSLRDTLANLKRADDRLINRRLRSLATFGIATIQRDCGFRVTGR